MNSNSNHLARNATLVLASTLTVMAGATIAPSLPAMEQHFSGHPNAQLWVQLIMTIPGLVIAVTAPLVGWLLDRWQRKPLLLSATILYAVSGTAGYWLEHSLLMILLSRLLLGVAVAGVMVTCTTLVGDYFDGAQRGKYMGLLAAFGAFGGVAFVGIGTWLATIHWQAPFLIYLAAIALLPPLIFYIEEPQTAPQAQHRQPAPPVPKRLLGFFFLLAFVEILVLYMVPVHLPFYLQTMSEAASGYGIAWMLLVMAVISCTYKVLQKLQSFAVLHGAGFALAALGCVYLGLAGNLWQVLLALTVLGIGLGVLRPNVVVWLMASTAPEVRGRVMGGLTSSFFIGQFLCPLITLPLVKWVGYEQMFLAVGTALAGAAVAVFCGAAFPARSANAVPVQK